MKKLILKRISLYDWKSINATVNFFNDKTFVSARTGVGKTSLYKAFCWLLSGYCDPLTTKNSDLYDNKEEITPDTPEAVVEALVDIEGREYTIRRSAKAKFRRPKGQSEWVKDSSDEYKISIDDIKFSQSEFDTWLSENVGPSSMITFMLSGEFFLNQVIEDKNKARDAMHGLIGDISSDEMIGDYSSINDLLEKHTTSEIIEQAKTRKNEIEKRLNELPAIIRNKQSTYQEMNQTDFEQIGKDIESYRNQIAEIDDLMLGSSKSIESLINERDRVVAVLSKVREGQTFARDAYNAAAEKRRAELESAVDDVDKKNEQIDIENCANKKACAKLNKTINERLTYIDELNNKRQELLAMKSELKSIEFSETKCPFCGREYDGESLEKRMSEFNDEKKQKMDDIVRKGKDISSEIKAAEEDVNNIREQIIDLSKEIKHVSKEDQLKAISDFEMSFVDFDDTEEGKAYIRDIESIKVPDIPSTDRDSLTAQKKAVMDLLDEANREYGMKRKSDELGLEIAKLIGEKKEFGVRLAEQERIIAKCKEYEQEKADIVSRHINDKLSYCHIDCWATQKDGTVVPALTVRRNDGVKYETANGASRILMAVDLQRFFCKYIGTMMPCFVDECSVLDSTNLPYSDDAQYIYLYCSENKILHITNIK